MTFKDQRSKIKDQNGFTLFELIATLTVLAILVMGTIPLMQNAAKRQNELRLRETLRTVREAIDQFHLDTYGSCPEGAITSTNPAKAAQQAQENGGVPTDPRTRVVVDDCTIFDNQNLDRYPPSLDVLVEGVKVKPRGLNITSGAGLGDDTRNATDLNADTEELTKVYLREMPVDPMTGETEWDLRSSYQPPDAESWDEINVFDIRSTSDGEALNGEKYSDW